MNTKKIAKYITIAALFLIPIFPLIVTNSLMFPFITGKAFYFRILVEIAFAGWIVLAFLDAKYRPKLTSLTIAVTAFALIALVADIFGVSPLRSLWSNFERMDGWINIIHLWALYIVMTNMFGKDEEGRKLWYWWLNFLVLIAGVVAIYGIFQWLGWSYVQKDAGRLDVPFGNSEFLGVYMIFSAFIALYLFITTKAKAVISKNEAAKKTPFRWTYILLVFIFGIITFGTQTRGAIIGLVGGILLSFILFAFFNKSQSKRLRFVAVCVIGLILLGGVVFWLNRNDPFIQKSPLLSRFASISLNDASNQARLYIWPMALEGAMERPVLGWGQENFGYVFQEHYNPALYDQGDWFDRAHNIFLDWLVNAGIIGLLSYLALYLFFVIYVWKSSMDIAEKSVLTGLLAAYAVNNLFVFDNLGSYVPFFAMLAYVNMSRDGRVIKWLGTNPVGAEAVNYAVIPITFIVLIFTLYFFNVRQIIVGSEITDAVSTCGNGNVNIEAFQSAINSNVYMAEQEVREQLYPCLAGAYWDADFSMDRKQEFTNLALGEMKKQIASTPMDSRSYYLAGQSLNQIGQVGTAETYLSKAYDLSSARQIFDFEFAADLIYMKNYTQALSI
jgi:O-antigen ligase